MRRQRERQTVELPDATNLPPVDDNNDWEVESVGCYRRLEGHERRFAR
jgi:hypothetical protein